MNTSWNFILKMDEDVILDKNCLIEMIKMNQKIAIKGIIGGKILYYKNKKIIQAIKVNCILLCYRKRNWYQ